MSTHPATPPPTLDPRKFRDPDVTAKGDRRAAVTLGRLDTLWFNTGTLCNIECRNCHIESSPRNDRLEYITVADVGRYLDEIETLELETTEVGFTGGEPFLNPEILDMVEDALGRGFDVLVLTNAMRPMMRPHVQAGLTRLRERFGSRLTVRVSLDHHTRTLHEQERGAGSWEQVLEGLKWLVSAGIRVAIAGRTCWGESEASERAGYGRLFEAEGIPVAAVDPAQLVLFPEMDITVDVPEITEACWGILDIDPSTMMCASSRMVVKRKGAGAPAVLACTLLPDDPQFELSADLAGALGEVKLNHPHCAKFCVLGGGVCSIAG